MCCVLCAVLCVVCCVVCCVLCVVCCVLCVCCVQEFVEVKRWAHLDIAGVMQSHGELPYLDTGMSGIHYHTIHTVIQWNFSNQDTNGAEESAIVSEVSSFQRLSKSGTWGGKRCPV